MPRKRKDKVVFDIPEDVQVASQAGWVQREAAVSQDGSGTSVEGAAPVEPGPISSDENPAAASLPARQYVWSVPAPGRLRSWKEGTERCIAVCAIPFEIGLTLALGLCSLPQELVSRVTGTAGDRVSGKDEH